MIPKQLTLQNFLSYRRATIDFNGLHTACICGANGAGKSSLLEAMTWAIWGQTRTATEEDVIHIGEKNVRVDFEFIYNYQTYKVIRTRQRQGGGTLDFQVESNGKFNPLSSAKGIREAQRLIIDCLKLDYETFINSAYLRQGRADEFMLRRPSERKQILADLLKLDQYENLANQSKDLAKQYKIKSEDLERNLEDINAQLQEREAITLELEKTRRELKELKQSQNKIQSSLQELQAVAHQRNSWERQLDWQKEQYQKLATKSGQIEREIAGVKTQLTQLEKILNERENIIQGYELLQSLQGEENNLRKKFQAYQETLEEKQKLEQQLREESNDLILTIQQEKTNLANLEKQEKDLVNVIEEAETIKPSIEKLNYYRQKLNQLDKIQHEVSPLQQRCQILQREIEKQGTKINVKIEQLQEQEKSLKQEYAQVPEKRKDFLLLEGRLQKLEKKRNYLERVREKGEEKKICQQKYQENQLILAKQIQELKNKLELLAEDRAVCPLCERQLDEDHLTHVIDKTLQQQKQLEADSWHYGEEIRNCERELENLREEYSKLNQELILEDTLKQNYAKLEDQLDSSEAIYLKLQQVREEKEQLQTLLETNNYALEFRQELEVLERQITNLNYDEKDHALARKQENNLRWAEIKQAKIEDARTAYEQLKKTKPEKLEQIANLENQLQQLTKTSPLQQKIAQKEEYLQEINYDSQRHNRLRGDLQTAQNYQLKYTELQYAQQQYPELQAKLKQLSDNLKDNEGQKQAAHQELKSIQGQIEEFADNSPEIALLEQECLVKRQQMDRLLTKKGGLEQSLTHLNNLQTELEETNQQLEETRKNYRVYEELAKAFGKNGIQALMIENILPQLEAEANQILARLTGNQLHVQFLTQKAKKKSGSKLKDTLEIQISDVKGTRAYETYSGGEAFRINFSIRLALARILAQRSGASLQMLIVDEGFGTQDSEGCDRLIAALNAIASDFACILTVTHIPQFKEAFQTRIEVYKNSEGSQIRLST